MTTYYSILVKYCQIKLNFKEEKYYFCYNYFGDEMKLLVSDFDGTYFTNLENLVKNNEKIHEFRKNGNLFMLSSGRSFKSLKEMCEKYNIEYDYLSCCDGSILYDQNDDVLVKYDLNEKILKEFLNLKDLVKYEYIQYSYQDDYYKEYKNNNLIGLNIVVKNEFINDLFLKELKFLENKYLEYDFLIYTHDDTTFFCLKNKGINKSSTVNHLKEMFKLNLENIYTVGDSENDYYMLKLFKGFYIGNPDDRIKNVSLKGYNLVKELIDDIEKSGI